VGHRPATNQPRRVAALSALVGDSMALRSNRRDLAALLAVEAHRLAPIDAPTLVKARFGGCSAGR
jgi:hypothetical protein